MRAQCRLRALRVAADVSGPAAPRILTPDHDISPPVEEQLVLELKLWIFGTKGLDVFPRSRRCRLTLPLNEDLLDSSRQS
jgi:hypothetical protein